MNIKTNLLSSLPDNILTIHNPNYFGCEDKMVQMLEFKNYSQYLHNTTYRQIWAMVAYWSFHYISIRAKKNKSLSYSLCSNLFEFITDFAMLSVLF